MPDILLVDEALVVGDARFRAKSQERIDEIRARAGTVVLVTHVLPEIQATCDRVIWIDEGLVRMEGDPEEVIEAYSASAEA